MPDEGVTGWDDLVRGRIEFPNEKLEDVVLVRSDGRPTYNFASPAEDMLDGITHVIRGQDHVSNTPKQLQLLRALGHEPPLYAHVPDVLGADGKKLSKRHGAASVDDFRADGYIPEALVNFLARLGWSWDDHTEIFTREELIERFAIERVSPSPAVFDYPKLVWLNGTWLRSLPPDEYADRLLAFVRERGYDWDEQLVRASAPLVQEKIGKLGEYPAFAGFFFERRSAPVGPGDVAVLAAAEQALREVEPFTAERVEAALRGVAERLEPSPKKAFQPIRLAVTGSKVSPGLFESIALLGKDESLARLSAAREAAA
jgi:glutamyl-tRNA synthetase